jgi:hypothetical protein
MKTDGDAEKKGSSLALTPQTKNANAFLLPEHE